MTRPISLRVTTRGLFSIVAGGFRLLRNPARLIAPRAPHASPPAPDRVGGRQLHEPLRILCTECLQDGHLRRRWYCPKGDHYACSLCLTSTPRSSMKEPAA